MTKIKNMTMFYATLGLIGGILIAISLFGYRYESGKKSKLIEENASKERKDIQKEVSELKEIYQTRIQKKGLQLAKELSQKYEYGFVLFGILEDEFLYPTTKFDSDIKITADWKNTELRTNPGNSDFYDLIIKNLKQIGSFGNNNKLNLSIGNYKITVPKLTNEKAVEISVVQLQNEARLFFELVDNDNKDTPIFVIGFKK